MTEKDLYCYIEAKKELHTARLNLREIDSIVNSPGSPSLSLSGRNDPKNSPDALSDKLYLLESTRKAEREAERHAAEALKRLNNAELLLNYTERLVFIGKYKNGLTIKQIAENIGYCERSVKRYLKIIKEKLKEV